MLITITKFNFNIFLKFILQEIAAQSGKTLNVASPHRPTDVTFLKQFLPLFFFLEDFGLRQCCKSILLSPNVSRWMRVEAVKVNDHSLTHSWWFQVEEKKRKKKKKKEINEGKYTFDGTWSPSERLSWSGKACVLLAAGFLKSARKWKGAAFVWVVVLGQWKCWMSRSLRESWSPHTYQSVLELLSQWKSEAPWQFFLKSPGQRITSH